ncbi:uncharacterized protein SPPG_01038 [Spizellomyces punctatus DAOM BR117]|uniref:Phytanoyl-CoA dioxygenase n=1 Tax=Spizellomyces punctatus (strain DAOM BR117) TaxID=645134 RepID=A0A0L0HR97_SPIPD|nr:uncharacterized protein SPPG_01038 [Spizellomyces punctatus DAOM BR117]KND03563.1 hypothetical protein SPPG_01038 [Spizellomyces punctatus DAOM BR117]|eukprot:XP_016611602.1 hypothetical protein SPPG_01038 [Spizellomyces punctatus DAOM BR117]
MTVGSKPPSRPNSKTKPRVAPYEFTSRTRHKDAPPASDKGNHTGNEGQTGYSTFPRMISAGTGSISVNEMLMTPANASPSLLRERFRRDGYLYIPQLIPREQVFLARRTIVQDLAKTGFLEPGCDVMDAVTKKSENTNASPSLLNRQDLANSDSVKEVLEHSALYRIFEILLCDEVQKVLRQDRHDRDSASIRHPTEQIQSHPYKWLRAVGRNLYTGPHVDRVYFPSYPLVTTAWIPLGDITTALGSLVVAPGSHRSPKFSRLRATYGNSRVGKDGTQSGWIADNPEEIHVKFGMVRDDIQWVSADVQMGDVCIIGLDTLHMSSNNVVQPARWRISCDTRWFRRECARSENCLPWAS